MFRCIQTARSSVRGSSVADDRSDFVKSSVFLFVRRGAYRSSPGFDATGMTAPASFSTYGRINQDYF
jgi:hypothetical protein